MTYHYRNLVNHVDNLIFDKCKKTRYGYDLSMARLSFDDLLKTSALFVEYDDRDTTDCFNRPDQDTKHDDITCALLSMLKHNSPSSRDLFASIVLENVARKYMRKIKAIINDRCEEVSNWSESA